MDFSVIKKHPYLIGGSIAGVVVLWIILRNSSQSSSSGGSGTSAADLQLAQLNAATGVQQSQIAAGVQVAQTQADVAKAQTDAALQASEFDTAAKLQLGTLQTQVDLAKTLAGDSTTVQLAQIASDATVKQAQIQSDTATSVAGIEGQVYETAIQAQKAVESQRISTVGNIVGTLQKYSKHYGSDIIASAPVISGILGAPAAGANAAAEIQASNNQRSSSIVNSITSGFTSIFQGLFGKAVA